METSGDSLLTVKIEKGGFKDSVITLDCDNYDWLFDDLVELQLLRIRLKKILGSAFHDEVGNHVRSPREIRSMELLKKAERGLK